MTLELNDRQKFVIDNHFGEHFSRNGTETKSRVIVSDNFATVFNPKTGRLHAHYMDKRYSGRQELVFESARSRATTLTSHRLKFWDRRRYATPRELARIQGFPESFRTPRTCASDLFGNAVAVPCARHACEILKHSGAEPQTCLDLCSGIGGFAIAAHQTWPHIAIEGFCEIKPAAISCYIDNFPSATALGDLTKRNEWPRVDLVMAGFPCQSFSRALKTDRQTHSTREFFLEIFRVVDASGANMVILENVRSMLNTARGFADRLMHEFRARRFHVTCEQLNASDFGLPQQRHRLYFIAWRHAPLLPLPFVPVAPITLGEIMEEHPRGKEPTDPTEESSDLLRPQWSTYTS
tara:strand:- start:270 stop:1322 length:1053 start_codon:yes stop_codon:yes gene_type:complete